MMTFTRDQFLAFSEVITETRQRLLQEQDQREAPSVERDAGFVM
jgi:hypothetical protein